MGEIKNTQAAEAQGRRRSWPSVFGGGEAATDAGHTDAVSKVLGNTKIGNLDDSLKPCDPGATPTEDERTSDLTAEAQAEFAFARPLPDHTGPGPEKLHETESEDRSPHMSPAREARGLRQSGGRMARDKDFESMDIFLGDSSPKRRPVHCTSSFSLPAITGTEAGCPPPKPASRRPRPRTGGHLMQGGGMACNLSGDSKHSASTLHEYTLCVLCHGISSDARDWDTWVELLEARFPTWKIMPLTKLSEGSRFMGSGLNDLADIAAAEVIGALRDGFDHGHGPPTTLHCVGHSMGGIVLRGAISRVFDEIGPDWLRFGHYLSLSTPHLGIQATLGAPLQTWKNLAWLSSFVSSQAAQLAVQDRTTCDDADDVPYLVSLASAGGPHLALLERFRSRSCVTLASGDPLIPLPSGVIDADCVCQAPSIFDAAFWRFEDLGAMGGEELATSVAPLPDSFEKRWGEVKATQAAQAQGRRHSWTSFFGGGEATTDAGHTDAVSKGLRNTKIGHLDDSREPCDPRAKPTEDKRTSDLGAKAQTELGFARPLPYHTGTGQENLHETDSGDHSPPMSPAREARGLRQAPRRSAHDDDFESMDIFLGDSSPKRRPVYCTSSLVSPAITGAEAGCPPLEPASSPIEITWRVSADGSCRFPVEMLDGLCALRWRRVVAQVHLRPMPFNTHVFLIGKKSEQYELEHQMSRQCIECLVELLTD